MRPANDGPGALRWPDSPAAPASRFRTLTLWARDDRRTRPTRVSTEPGHAIPRPARIGEEGIPSLYRAPTRAHGPTDVPDYAEWPRRVLECRLYGRRFARLSFGFWPAGAAGVRNHRPPTCRDPYATVVTGRYRAGHRRSRRVASGLHRQVHLAQERLVAGVVPQVLQQWIPG